MSLARLVRIMRRLRDPEIGCEWDRAQSFKTIAPFTIEEAYEVADAIDRGDMAGLANELGDLQLQVVFHALIGEDGGHFSLEDVLEGICDKLERRHPHIFGDAPSSPGWEELKAAERNVGGNASAVDGIALALPALDRAAKLQRRAARVGFDWPDTDGPRRKISEELGELDRAADQESRAEELGDLLFAVVNLSRYLNIDPETALKAASHKFERRFRSIETAPGFAELSLDEMERLWTAAKQNEAL